MALRRNIFYKSAKSMRPFIMEVNSGASGTFTIPIRNSYTYNYSVKVQGENIWFFSQTGDCTITFPATNTDYVIEISGLFPIIYFNDTGDKDKLIDIKQWGDIEWTSMQYAFRGCSNTTCTATDTPDLSSVTTMGYMFFNCTSLTTLDVSNWDVSSVTNMGQMFQQCTSLTTLDVSNWDVSSVTNMYWMLLDCSSLTTLDVSNWDVSSVTNTYAMFARCASLTTLDVSNWDVSSVTNMQQMFESCSSLTTLDVSNWDVSSVTNMYAMFARCSSLTTLDVSNWDVSSVTNMSNMFYDAKYELLSEIDFSDPIKGSINVSNIVGFCGYNSTGGGIQVRIPKVKMQAGNVQIQAQQWLTYLRPFQSPYITKLEMIGLKVSWRIDYMTGLVGTAIDDFFNALDNANLGEEVTMTTAQSTSGINTTIATSKGWTIVIV